MKRLVPLVWMLVLTLVCSGCAQYHQMTHEESWETAVMGSMSNAERAKIGEELDAAHKSGRMDELYQQARQNDSPYGRAL